MAIEVGALRALLSLDSAAFSKGAERAQASMNNLQRRLDQASRRMRSIGRQMTRNMTLPLAGIATVAVRSSLRTIDAQSKMAQSLGTSTRSMQVLQRAADRAGLSQGEVAQITQQLTRRLSQAAAGGGPAAKSLDRLGLSAEALSEMDLDQRIETVNTAIRDTIPASEQAAVAATIFGDRAGLLASRLDPETIATASSEIERFGVAVSEVEADRIEEANDALSALGLVSRGVANQLAVALAPTLKAIAERIASVGQWFANLSPRMQQIVGIAAAVATGLGPVAIGLGLVLAGLTPLVSTVGLVVAGLASLGAVVFYVTTRWNEITERFPVLQTVLDGVLVALEAFKTGFVASWEFISEQVGLAISAIGKFLTSDFSGALKDTLTLNANVADAIVGAFSALWEKIKPKLTGLAKDIKTWAEGVPAKIKEGLNRLAAAAKEAIAEMATALQSAISDLARNALTWASELGADIVAGLRKGISDKWDGFKSWTRGLFGQVEEEARDVTETRSPSRAMARVGVDIVEGLQVGMESRQGALQNSVRGLANSVTSIFENMRDGITGAIGDALVGLGGGLDAIKSTVQRGLSGLISNTLSSAFGGGGSSSGGGSPGAGGIASSLFGGSGLLGGVGAGAKAALGLGGFSSAGIFNIGANAAAAAATGVGSFAASIGAALPVIGIAAAAFSFFRKKVTELDYGIRVTTNGMDALIETFRTTETTRFWGLSKKIRTEFEAASDGVASPIQSSIDGIGQSVVSLADTLNLESARISAAEFQFQISTKGRSEADIQRDIERQLGDLADTFTNAIVGTYSEFLPDEAEIARVNKQLENVGNGIRAERDPLGAKNQQALLEQQRLAAETAIEVRHLNEEFAQFQKEGEGAFDTLQRLSSNLLTANEALRDLGFEIHEVSLAGAGAASEFVDLFGGIQGFTSATSAYYQQFYSSAERAEIATGRLSDALTALGVDVMPTTNAQFREMVDAAMAAGNSELAAGLIQLAPAFVELGGATDALNASMSSVVDRFYTTGQQLEFYTDQANKAFAEAGLAMPATADAFRDAAMHASSEVQRLMGMVRQGQASLGELQRAQQRQAELMALAERAARVYDLQAEIEADKQAQAEAAAAAAEEATRAAAAAEAERKRVAEEASAAAQRAAEQAAAAEAAAAAQRQAAQERAAEAARQAARAAESALGDLFNSVGEGIRRLLGLSSSGRNLSANAAENVIREAISTGRVNGDQFRDAVSALSDLDASGFASFADFQREQLRRAGLLDIARRQLGFVSPGATNFAGVNPQQVLSGVPAAASASDVNRRLAAMEGYLRAISASNGAMAQDIGEFTNFTLTEAAAS